MRQFGLALVIELLFAMVLPPPASGQEARSRQSTDSRTEIISARAGSAAETARILDELYNGSGTDRKPRIVVFAIPMTNCLFIKATSDDLLAIKVLLRPL